MTPRGVALALLALGMLVLSGCSAGVETAYGRVRKASVNGTGILAELFRERGHTVRPAVRLTDELSDWSNVIVRFAPRPGPPDREEAAWYVNWMTAQDGRRVIYVPRDFDARADYWSQVVDGLPKGADPKPRERAEKLRDKAKDWAKHLPPESKTPAEPLDWFAVEGAKTLPEVCRTLTGPWAAGVDPEAAALTRHATLKIEAETVLLAADGLPLVIEWTRFNESRVLVVANGSFLLNATLLNRARRPLARRVVDWVGADPARVAFVEGSSVLKDPDEGRSIFGLLTVPPFGWIAAQMLALGLAACLARAPRLGRARPDPPSGEDRPVAHPEALGALLARTRQAADARAILDAYRRWRHPGRSSGSSSIPPIPGLSNPHPDPLPEGEGTGSIPPSPSGSGPG
jgi:hypothetical protein